MCKVFQKKILEIGQIINHNYFFFKVKDGLNAVPVTVQEKAHCQKILTPQQLHQVIVG